MKPNDIATQIYNNFTFPPTSQQKKVISALCNYIILGDRSDIFVLCGYAGTGKTTIIAALVKALEAVDIKFHIMAPTGRAAKVASLYSERAASTIHKKIYRQRSFGADGGNFSLNYNKDKECVYIVDEASMLSNQGGESAFGSGMLLDDLVEYVNMGDYNRLILIGDSAQLPPVGLSTSPALDPNKMCDYGDIHYSTLNEVVRSGQGKSSAILHNATAIREYIDSGVVRLPSLSVAEDVRSINGSELIEAIEDSYREVGREDTIIITRSNKRAVEYNRGVRHRVLEIEEELSAGDMIMVVKNNYAIAERENCDDLDFIANGDIAIVERVVRHHEIYGCRFATVQIRLPDYNDYRLECKVLLDTLYSDAPSLTRAQSEALFYEIEKDYVDIAQKNKRYKAIMTNEYWGALHIKFAYAVTCHKAQGGQWSRVFIDRMLFGDEQLTIDFQRWLYTAITRSTHRVYFVNWDEHYFEK